MLRYTKDLIGQIAAWVIKALIARIRDPLIRRATMTPYFHLLNGRGETYMLRYWLVPYAFNGSHSEDGCGPVKFWHRPVAWVLQKLGVAVRVHGIMRSDDDRAYHDHPWNFMSVILDGAYWEHRPVYDDGLYAGDSCTRYEAGSVIFRRAGDLHRLDLSEGQIVWTLFITGPRKQAWGFVEKPSYKEYYRDYLARREEDEDEDDYNYEAGVLLDFIVNGFGATEDHETIRNLIRKESVEPLTDEEINAIMRRIVKPCPQVVEITIKAEGGEASGIALVLNTQRKIEPHRASWLTARCKECNGITHASKWWLPLETGPMDKERGKLEAEGRYPVAGERPAVMDWCQGHDAPGAIAHRAFENLPKINYRKD